MPLLRALGASAAGSLAGFLAGTGCFLLALWRPWAHTGITVLQLLDLRTSGLVLYYFVIAALSLIGWLVFVLPVALRFTRDKVRPARTVIYGVLTGLALVTLAYTLLFHGEPQAVRGSIIFEMSAGVNAATATAVCLVILQRWPV